METESAILRPGVMIVCPPAMPFFFALREQMRKGSAKVVVLHSYQRKLTLLEAFGVHQSVTLRHLAREGGGMGINALIKGLFFYWSRILMLQNEVCGIVAFENSSMHKLDQVRESVEGLWAEGTKPNWTVEFLTGDMKKLYLTLFPAEEISKMERVARSMQELN